MWHFEVGMGINVTEVEFSTVARDTQIDLPIFQRGKVWNDEKKFGFVLSAILNYPVGAISVLTEYLDIDGIPTQRNQLLDGQQRSDAIKAAFFNPPIVLKWATSVLNIKKLDEIDDVKMKLRFRTLCYFGAITPQEDSKIAEDIDACKRLSTESAPEHKARKKQLIYNLYQEASNNSNYVSELGDPFDNIPGLSDLATFLYMIKYRINTTGETPLSALLLKPRYYKEAKHPYQDEADNSLMEGKFYRMIQEYTAWNQDFGRGGLGTHEHFQEYWFERHESKIKENSDVPLNQIIEDSWDDKIKPILTALIQFRSLFGNAKIGKIHIRSEGVREYTAYDMMKIFDLINTQGEPLSLVEILAAKYYWREDVVCTGEYLKKILSVNKKLDYLNFPTRMSETDVLELEEDKIKKWHIASSFYEILSHEKVLHGVIE